MGCALAVAACSDRSTPLGAAAERGNAELQRNVEAYLALRAAAAADVGRLRVTRQPADLEQTVDELALEIRQRRHGAAEGQVLSAPVATAIRAVLRERLDRPDGRSLRAAIGEVQPQPFAPRVNAQYPESQPRATMPGPLLEVLPELPRILAFRFVGRDLLLIDRNTGVIVDILRDAIPRV